MTMYTIYVNNINSLQCIHLCKDSQNKLTFLLISPLSVIYVMLWYRFRSKPPKIATCLHALICLLNVLNIYIKLTLINHGYMYKMTLNFACKATTLMSIICYLRIVHNEGYASHLAWILSGNRVTCIPNPNPWSLKSQVERRFWKVSQPHLMVS